MNWYAVYTQHQHEKRVARVLVSKGLETFLPLYSAIHNWKDRVKVVLLPLFPCYVFVRTEINHRLDVLSTPGIHAIVSSAGQPATVPEAQIEAVRKAIDGGWSIEPHPVLKYGDRMRVKSGALRGLEGILIRKRNIYRLVLSVEILGQAASVEIDAAALERVDSTGSSFGLRGIVPQTRWERSDDCSLGSF